MERTFSLRIGTGTPIQIRVVTSESFGEELAEQLADATAAAKAAGQTLVFDMATGSTPKAAWPVIQQMIASGRIDPTNVIIMGHEEAWGSFQPGDKPDFDAYRRCEWFERNGLAVRPITRSNQVPTKGEIEGNFIPMRLADNAAEAAVIHEEILAALRARKDITWFGLYGVGTDSHIAEVQPHDFAFGRTPPARTYPIDVTHYSVENGAFRWSDGQGDFHPEDNIFWTREATGTDVGRAVAERYGGIQSLSGLGWQDLLHLDTLVLAFNNVGKARAFEMTLSGQIDGHTFEATEGESERILPDLQNFAGELGLEVDEMSTCAQVADAVYALLNTEKALADDTRYQRMWRFANRYLGQQSPTARLVRERARLGKTTTMVVTKEVRATSALSHLP